MVQKRAKSNYYVDPKEFIAEYHKSVELGKPTNKLIAFFTKIATGFISLYNGKNQCDTNACINYAVAEAWQKWNKFDETRSDNIFSFFTTIISNDLRLHYKQITKGKERKIYIESLFMTKE